MAFDWLDFFHRHHIDYVTEGPNVARGNAAIQCPWCGPEDPGHHLGVHLGGKGWGCWRRADHRGKSATRLVQMLLSCSQEEAQRIVYGTTYIPNDFLAQVQEQFAGEADKPKPRKLKLLEEFKPIGSLPSGKPYVRYLMEDRGFTREQVMEMTERFDMLYCTRGPYHGRVIFPVYFEGELVSWTGRSIHRSATLRYKSLSHDPEKAEEAGLPPAVGPIAHYLLWFDDLMDQAERFHTLYLVEGPHDALKVRVLGEPHGITATCLFTANLVQQQVELLHALVPRFKKRFMLLDRTAIVNSLRAASTLSALSVGIKEVPPGVKDPALLTERKLLELSA